MRGATVIAPGAKASASGKSQVMKMSTTSTVVEPAAGPRQAVLSKDQTACADRSGDEELRMDGWMDGLDALIAVVRRAR